MTPRIPFEQALQKLGAAVEALRTEIIKASEVEKPDIDARTVMINGMLGPVAELANAFDELRKSVKDAKLPSTAAEKLEAAAWRYDADMIENFFKHLTAAIRREQSELEKAGLRIEKREKCETEYGRYELLNKRRISPIGCTQAQNERAADLDQKRRTKEIEKASECIKNIKDIVAEAVENIRKPTIVQKCVDVLARDVPGAIDGFEIPERQS